ncbi:Panacea domain-containing protein [Liquorilactobacillus satsumensis]|uniref:Panacea domain-containing protein n=1 Tax=Liquorilactobacillus satsumensis TaxID=259059 RepID=UPI0039EBB9AE
MKAKYTAIQVANWFLSSSSMSPKKLQKMLYYAYAWVLTLTNDNKDNLDNRLFDDDRFEAWVHGPVLPNIYQEFKIFGYEEIPARKANDSVGFTPDIEGILKQVQEVYGGYTADELESITHQEAPWKNARNGYSPIELCQKEISDRDIYDCYIQRVA